MSDQKGVPNILKFVFGAGAGMGATCFVQPLDLIKNRMQLSGVGGKVKEYRSTFHACQTIVSNEGLFALYNGISAGLLRQATYTGTRLGVYTYLFEMFKQPDGTAPNFATKISLGMVAGICGAFVGTPAEISLIRMTADGRLPPQERRNYKNVFDALFRIYREEGLLTLWRGAMPTMGRAVAVNAAQLSTYSQAKQLIVEHFSMADGIPLHFVSSMISGLITTIVSMPFDIAKTSTTAEFKNNIWGLPWVLVGCLKPSAYRPQPQSGEERITLSEKLGGTPLIQNMRIVDGVAEYRGPTDVFFKLIRNEGIFALWKGFLPYYLRLGPHTVLTFIFLEQLNAAYFKYVLGRKSSGGL